MRLLIDTNLLMLYVAGRADTRIIGTHKRLRTFDVDDYDWLRGFTERYEGLTLTPNTTTEASNLLAQIADPFRSYLRDALSAVTKASVEVYVPSAAAMRIAEYNWLGLTDAAILSVAGEQSTMLTTDLSLYRAAAARGLSAVSYAEARYESLR